MNNRTQIPVSSSGGAYETSSSRQSRFLSSRGDDRYSSVRGEDRYSSLLGEERITSSASNGGLDAIKTSSIRSYSSTDGVAAIGKPKIKRTCKGVTIERKFHIQYQRVYDNNISPHQCPRDTEQTETQRHFRMPIISLLSSKTKSVAFELILETENDHLTTTVISNFFAPIFVLHLVTYAKRNAMCQCAMSNNFDFCCIYIFELLFFDHRYLKMYKVLVCINIYFCYSWCCRSNLASLLFA